LWGAPRIHGELLKLGFELAESTVSKYMIKHRGPPSQTWRTFLRNHADAIAAIDLCVVSTLTFGCLFAFLVVSHGRRRLLWFAVTTHPTGMARVGQHEQQWLLAGSQPGVLHPGVVVGTNWTCHGNSARLLPECNLGKASELARMQTCPFLNF
jgi:hypothetical protein